MKEVLRRITHAKKHNLSSLDLSNLGLKELPIELFQLNQIENLILFDNKLNELSDEIGKLKKLRILNIGNNELTDLPESISKLKKLTELYIHSNKFNTELISLIKLYNIKRLDISGCNLSSLPSGLKNLKKLNTLYINRNKLTTLPDWFQHLETIESLDLSRNKFKIIPDQIKHLSKLYSIDLSFNHIDKIPSWIGGLNQIHNLNLHENNITVFPACFKKLNNIRTIYISSNNIKNIPNWITGAKSLITLDIKNNPIDSPPYEIASKGIDSIQNFFRNITKDGTTPLYEAKLIIIGESGAGKTSLAKKIINPQYILDSKEPSTHGIRVMKWNFNSSKNIDFATNIWDFGGQEIYHETHQFFLTRRSLYVLLTDSRREDTDFKYWLNFVKILGENSPVMIVKNKRQNRIQSLNKAQLINNFPNIRSVSDIDLSKNDSIDNIINLIKVHLTDLDHIGTKFPVKWANIRSKLQEIELKYIQYDDYSVLCSEYGVLDDESKLQLLNFLHDLGDCLHFQTDAILKNYIILDPEWATRAVYQILDNSQIIDQAGHFSRSDLASLWSNNDYHEMHDILIKLMTNFKLCYEIPNKKNEYIAPQLLSKDQPDYDYFEKKLSKS